MAKQPVAEKRQRRERGSINPDDIIKGAFELAEQVGIDNLSMPLRGKHLGVLRQAFPPDGADPHVTALLDQAVEDLRTAGATVVDPFMVPAFAEFPPQPHPASEVRAALEAYLATTSAEFPKTMAEIQEAKKFHPLLEARMRATVLAPPPSEDPTIKRLEALEIRMREAYGLAMKRDQLDAFVLPAASYPPKLNGDRNVTPAGPTTWIASGMHWPAAVVPWATPMRIFPRACRSSGGPGRSRH